MIRFPSGWSPPRAMWPGILILLARKTSANRTLVNEIPALTFNTYGETRFLSKIRTGGTSVWEIVPGSTEAKLVKSSGEPQIADLRAESPEKN
jgi:hypothetical protein